MPKTRKIFVYKKTHLPIKGWLQGCFRCYTFTSKYFLFNTFHNNNNLYEFYIHTCPQCSKNFKKNPLLYVYYSKKCNTYIETHFNYLLTGGS